MVGMSASDNLPNTIQTCNGTVNGADVVVMLESGCTTVGVRRSLVSDDQLTGETQSCRQFDGTIVHLPMATVDYKRIDYKLSTLCFNFFSGSSPAYFSELLTVYSPARQLRASSDCRILTIPHTKTKTYGQRTFTFCAPTQWNSLPFHIRHSQSPQAFKRALKTHLFKKYNP
ncbi:hypothetical protein V1264_009209 [Littorina saxatilis]|uniref:Uncharacterized protein n=1 Tax=Littorina saxatilis TaxID=31220 RepID=A0AAN9AQY6_9CAEN